MVWGVFKEPKGRPCPGVVGTWPTMGKGPLPVATEMPWGGTQDASGSGTCL